MNFNTDGIRQYFAQHGLLFFLANMVVILCTSIILFAILIDFIRYHTPTKNKKKIISWVDTGTMFVYFLVYYILMHLKTGRITIESKV
jgi:hypothetical protein